MTGLIEKLSNAWTPVHRTGSVPGASAQRGAGLLGNAARSSRSEQLAQMGAVGTLFSIVDRIASSQSQIQWHLYQRYQRTHPNRTADQERTEITSHLALDLLRKPNEFHTGEMLIEMGQQHYELTGETWIIIDRDDLMREVPLGLWVVRPDRIEPVPGQDTFLAGYVYTSVDGEQVPLLLDEVLCVKRANPEDPYRGLGAVQSVMLELQSSRAVAEWNRNFFRNGAMPGGVIEVDGGLEDHEFQDLVTRWRESHRGVSRAHRVGVLEHGAKFNTTTYSVKDLMVTEMRGMTRDAVMEAFGISRHMLGITDDVNRSNADAGEYLYAKYVDRTRAIRWRGMLNNFYLPMFGDARPLEFDFDSPVPEDAEAANAERESKARATKDYVDAGYEPEDVLTTVDVPPMRHTGTVPNRTAPQQEATA